MNDQQMSRREYRRKRRQCILQSLPAVLVPIVVVSLVWAGWQTPRGESIETYKVAAGRAIERKDWESAELCLRKLVYLDETDAQTQYRLAVLAEQQGNPDRARHLMQQVATTERAGYAPAHFWLARHMLSSKPPQDPDETQQRAKIIEKHLRFTIEKQPDNLAAHELLGRVYVSTGQLDPAARHFAKAVRGRPALRLPLAKIYVSLDRKSSAKTQAEAAVEHYSKRIESDETDVESRLQLAFAQLFLEQFNTAEATMQQGLALTEDERFRPVLARLYVTWFDRTEATRLRFRLELLQRALSYAPGSPTVLERLALFAGHEGAKAEEAMAILQKALARGDAPAAVHVILGTLATSSGDHQKGIFHLEQAFSAHPKMPVVANNLAWALAHAEPPQFERALSLINATLEASPNHPEMRDTRGVIYLKQNRFKEAITDLEAVLNRMPNDVRIRENLAMAYEKLGHAELAAEQRRIIEILEKQQEEEEVQEQPQK